MKKQEAILHFSSETRGANSHRMHNQTTIQSNGSEIQRANRPNKAKFEVFMADFILSSLWVCSSSIIDLIVYRILGFEQNQIAEAIECAFKVANMFFFALISGEEGSYNPLSVLIGAISANFNRFLFTLGARIPVQVFGSILGAKLLTATFTDIQRGPKLNVEIHHGALTEGTLAFIIAIISMALARSLSGCVYRKNWISSISRISLQILCSDLTGACMNPAIATAWAFARGDHITKEHIIVYWLAPVEATLLAVWVFNLLFQIGSDEKMKKKKTD